VSPYPGPISQPDTTRADRRTSERRDAKKPSPPLPVRRYVGIDLATEAKRTGVVIIELDGSTAIASMPAQGFVADDRGLVEVIDRATVVGLDSPLGWPDDFVSAVTAHRQSARWPTFEHRSTDKIRESLRHRKTDLFVRSLDLGSTPLSVSSDLIGVVAMRGAWLQSAWAQKWGGLEPRDGSGRLVETYPAAALRAWGLLARRGVRYKGGGVGELREGQRSERARIMREIEEQTGSWLRVPELLRVAAVASDHTLDAFICALVALAARANVTHSTPEESRDAALREGWIHVPNDALSSLGACLPEV
jgi:predicted nuclease with RNAse H fold